MRKLARSIGTRVVRFVRSMLFLDIPADWFDPIGPQDTGRALAYGLGADANQVRIALHAAAPEYGYAPIVWALALHAKIDGISSGDIRKITNEFVHESEAALARNWLSDMLEPESPLAPTFDTIREWGIPVGRLGEFNLQTLVDKLARAIEYMNELPLTFAEARGMLS